jgi:hypothetical protein
MPSTVVATSDSLSASALTFALSAPTSIWSMVRWLMPSK